MKTVVYFLAANLVIGTSLAQVASAQPALDELEKRLDRILLGRKAPPADPEAAPASPEAGFLGLTADQSETLGGVQIVEIEKAGPAESAGLKNGDLVLAINRTSIRTLDDMAAVLSRLKAGDKVEFEVLRSGRRVAHSVTLGRRPAGGGAVEAPKAEPLPPPRADERRASLGVRIVDATDDVRRRYGLSVRRGAVISAITEGGAAHRAGLAIGDVVVSADDQRVDVAEDLIRHLRTVRADTALDIKFYRGDRLFRSNVKLDAIAAAPPRPAPDVPPRAEPPRIFGEDRPALRKIEGVIGRLTTPDRGGSAEVTVLKHEVELLRQQVKLLEEKVRDLEARLPRSTP